MRYWECIVEDDAYYIRSGRSTMRDNHTWQKHIAIGWKCPSKEYMNAHQAALYYATRLWKSKGGEGPI